MAECSDGVQTILHAWANPDTPREHEQNAVYEVPCGV